jgi:hypothetical protein
MMVVAGEASPLLLQRRAGNSALSRWEMTAWPVHNPLAHSGSAALESQRCDPTPDCGRRRVCRTPTKEGPDMTSINHVRDPHDRRAGTSDRPESLRRFPAASPTCSTKCLRGRE